MLCSVAGAMMMSQFLEGCNTTRAIAWLDIDENKENIDQLPTPMHIELYNKINNNKYKLLSGLLLSHYLLRDGHIRAWIVNNGMTHWLVRIYKNVFNGLKSRRLGVVLYEFIVNQTTWLYSLCKSII